ncbi:hypothetical protein [Corynebacterium sphenisci]|uniref:hypothetical protein n=1 Tax=Corynebacterium sphenisci TaxID=191493 RepID=UPI0026E07A6A|nr:hypothetical protein [Corynebacterium sphenisci]MDO5730713.1 hypothetical protein [Corynebacterium sphenisci]
MSWWSGAERDAQAPGLPPEWAWDLYQPPRPEPGRSPERDPTPLTLPGLLGKSREALLGADPLTAARIRTRFAQRHWLAGPRDLPRSLPEELRGEFHRLRFVVGDCLELTAEAAEAHRSWLEWARRADLRAGAAEGPETLLCRATGLAAAAPRLAATARRQAVAELAELGGRLPAAPRRAGALQLRAALLLARAAIELDRPEPAERLLGWLPGGMATRPLLDGFRLLSARASARAGEPGRAAADCLYVAKNPVGEPVTAAVSARLLLAELSRGRGEVEEEIRRLRVVAAACTAQGLDLLGLRVRRRLAAALLALDDPVGAEAHLDAAAPMAGAAPLNPVSADLDLLRARARLRRGDPATAARLAEAIADLGCAAGAGDQPRTACAIAADAHALAGRPDRAAAALVRSAGHLRREGRPEAAARRLSLAARALLMPVGADAPTPDPGAALAALHRDFGALADAPPAPELAGAAEDGPVAAAALLLGVSRRVSAAEPVELDRRADLARILMLIRRSRAAITLAEDTAGRYAAAGRRLLAAELLIVAAACRRAEGDREGLHRCAERIEGLLPPEAPPDFWVREQLAILLRDDGG